MDLNTVIATMCALFAIVIVGFLAFRTKLVDEAFSKTLSRLVIQITCPALIIASSMGDKMPDRTMIPSLLIVSALTYIVMIPLAYLIPWLMRVKTDLRGMYSFMLAYSNVGFIGYPVVASIFGQEAVFYASILNVFNTLTVFIWGIMFISGDSLRGGFHWKLFVSPAMISTYISLIIVLLGLHTPKAIAMPLTILGNMTVPSSLLVIGIALAGIPAKKMLGTPHIFMMCFLKLLVIPILLYYIVITVLGVIPAIGEPADAAQSAHKIASINMMLIAMPVASFGTMFCLKLGKDETTMTQGTFWSTVLSVASIPLLFFLMH